MRLKAAEDESKISAADITGLTPEDILKYFYDVVSFERVKRGWKTPLNTDMLRGVKLTADLINAKTGRVAAEAGTKMTPRLLRQLVEKGMEEQLVAD